MSFRARLRPLKRAAEGALTRLWDGGFRAVARLKPLAAPRWNTPGHQRVLVVAPHPDDEAVGCPGTILLHALAQDEVRVAIATDGRRSRMVPDPQEMARQRRLEAHAAAQRLQIARLEWLGLPEGEWHPEQLRALLRAQLLEFQPHLIYAPSRIDFHPEHIRVAHALALALQDAPGLGARVRVYQVQVPLTALMVNLVADVSRHATEVTAVIEAYRSQRASLAGMRRVRRYSALRHRMSGEAEEFWEISADDYVRLHGEIAGQGLRTFRSVRPFPATDPLAYLVGRSRRRGFLESPGTRPS